MSFAASLRLVEAELYQNENGDLIADDLDAALQEIRAPIAFDEPPARAYPTRAFSRKTKHHLGLVSQEEWLETFAEQNAKKNAAIIHSFLGECSSRFEAARFVEILRKYPDNTITKDEHLELFDLINMVRDALSFLMPTEAQLSFMLESAGVPSDEVENYLGPVKDHARSLFIKQGDLITRNVAQDLLLQSCVLTRDIAWGAKRHWAAVASATNLRESSRPSAPLVASGHARLSVPESGPVPYLGKKKSGPIREFLKAAYPHQDDAWEKPLTLNWLKANDPKAYNALYNQSEPGSTPTSFLPSDPNEGDVVLSNHNVELETEQGIQEAKRLYGLLGGRLYPRFPK